MEVKWLRRPRHRDRTQVCVPVPNHSSALRDLRFFGKFLTKHTVEAAHPQRLLCVTGDSASLLPFFYHQLPVALSMGLEEACKEACEVRLVTHELASKGLVYCQRTQAFLLIHEPGLRESNSPIAPRKEGTIVPPTQVQWYVPRLVANCTRLDALFASWVPPQEVTGTTAHGAHKWVEDVGDFPFPHAVHSVCVVLFLNSDIVEDDVFTDQDGCDLAQSDASTRRVERPSESSLRVMQEVARFFPDYFCDTQGTATAHRAGDAGMTDAQVTCAATAPGTASGAVSSLTVPVLRLTSMSPFFRWNHLRALASLQDGLNPAQFFRHSCSANALSALLPRHSSGGWLGGGRWTRVSTNYFLRPCIYANTQALAAGARAAQLRHHMDAHIVEALHDTKTLRGADALPLRDAETVVHRYYPLISHVGDLLHRACCLSDVYVVELSCEELFLASCLEGWRSRRHIRAKRTLDSSSASADDVVYDALMMYLSHSTTATRSGLELALCRVIEAMSAARRVFAWPLGDSEGRECVPRVALCVSHEVFRSAHIQHLLDEERTLVEASPANAAQAGLQDGVKLSPTREEDLPSTVGYLIKSVLAHVRERGWILVHQEAHHVWDSALQTSGYPEPTDTSARTTSLDRDALQRRVFESADDENFEKQSAVEAARRQMRRYRPRPWSNRRTHEEDQKDTRSPNGDHRHPTGYTSHELWYAAGLPPSVAQYPLALYRGARVALPNGRRGVVVGFAPPPAWVTTEVAAHRKEAPLDQKHKAFSQWCRAQARMGNTRWKPCLPPFVTAAERSVWPVVQFQDSDAPSLVLPSVVRHYHVIYPRVCVVSAAQQRLARATAEALRFEASEVTSGEPVDARDEARISEHEWPSPLDDDGDESHDALWSLQAVPSTALGTSDSLPEGGVASITTVSLPLQVHLGVTAASLFYAAVLLRQRGVASTWNVTWRVPTGAVLARQQRLQMEWQGLHDQRRAASLADGSMGAVAPTSLPMRTTRWQLHVKEFLQQPRALRCVAASVPDLGLVTLDSPSMWSALTRAVGRRL